MTRKYADPDEFDQKLNLDGHGRLRRVGGRARGRLHVRFSDDDALLSPISPLSPLPAAGTYDSKFRPGRQRLLYLAFAALE